MSAEPSSGDFTNWATNEPSADGAAVIMRTGDKTWFAHALVTPDDTTTMMALCEKEATLEPDTE